VKRCVTHYKACDCREYLFERMQTALSEIANRAQTAADSPRANKLALRDIRQIATSALDPQEAFPFSGD
jgi:aminoglycoside N3'-acetyltransferase